MSQTNRRKAVGIPNRRVANDLAESVLPSPPGNLTAFDFKDELQSMLGLTDDELRALPVRYGSQLEANEMYFDLDHPERGELRATEQSTINPGCRYVARATVPEDLWYRLAASAGLDEMAAGNAAPTPGAFGHVTIAEPSAEPVEKRRENA